MSAEAVTVGGAAYGGHNLAAAVDAICAPAAAAIAEVYARLAEVRAATKPDGSAVTEADLRANRLLTDGLRRAFADWPVVSEEDPGSHARPTTGPYWLVDPLDGTREFLAGTGEFCVCVGLVEAGAPVFGYVLAPATGQRYYAWRGAGGAFAKTSATAPARRLPRRAPLDRGTPGLRIGVSRHHRDAAADAFLAGLNAPVPVPMGSALKFCAVAAGELDGYVRPGPTMHWDTAAGQCIAEAVGAGVRELATGARLRYDTPTRRNPGFAVVLSAS